MYPQPTRIVCVVHGVKPPTEFVTCLHIYCKVLLAQWPPKTRHQQPLFDYGWPELELGRVWNFPRIKLLIWKYSEYAVCLGRHRDMRETWWVYLARCLMWSSWMYRIQNVQYMNTECAGFHDEIPKLSSQSRWRLNFTSNQWNNIWIGFFDSENQ